MMERDDQKDVDLLDVRETLSDLLRDAKQYKPTPSIEVIAFSY